MPPKQTRRTREEADSHESLRQQDPLIRTNAGAERPFTIARLFKEKINEGLGKLMDPDWSELKQRLHARNATDTKPWFLQVGVEEVGSDPRGNQTVGDVYQVQFVGIAEAESNDTLSPSTFIIREHRVNADIEDCQPEKIRAMANHGFQWLEILKDDAVTSTNCFLLVTKRECDELLKKEQSFFGFGAPATTTESWSAPTTTSSSSNTGFGSGFGGFGSQPQQQQTAPAENNNAFAGFGSNNNTNNAFAGFGSNNNTNNDNNNNNAFAGFGGFGSNNNTNNAFAGFGSNNNTNNDNNNNNAFAGFGGFGSNNNTSSSSNNNFGFGSYGASNTDTNFALPGFGAAVPQTSTTPAVATSTDAAPKTNTVAAPAAALPTASTGVPRDAKDVQFQLFSLKSLKEMQTITTAGSKIVLENVPLSDGTKWKKLKMENDLHDKPAASAQDSIDRQFAKENADMKELAEWLDDCPIADPKVIEPLVTVRERALKMYKAENEEEYEALAKHKKELEEALKVVVDQRKAEIALEKAILEQVLEDLKGGRVLSREKWRILKFHPNNDVVKFRPHNKFRALGLVDVCVPAAFDAVAARQSNSFFKRD